MTATPTHIEQICEIANSPRVAEIVIGTRIYALGLLSPAALADLSAWGTRIVDSQKAGGLPLGVADRDPSRILRALLRAGDPMINFKSVLPYVKREHFATAGAEYSRQAYAAALADTKGSA
jgi:hypothetical protein